VQVNLVPKRATGLSDYKIAKIAAGEHHALALTEDGKILAWGRPTYGRLGRDDVEVGSDTGVGAGVVKVEGLESAATGVAAGGAVSGCFSADMCGLWLCGFGSTGQLAKGADDDDDEKTMTKVKRTKVFNEVRLENLEFGGQHVVMLAVPCPAAESKEGAVKDSGKAKSGDAVKDAVKYAVKDAEKDTAKDAEKTKSGDAVKEAEQSKPSAAS
jgi:alpha-tubulin suppressor-like RCC1 family protein